jgi:autotransporter translocation and assembly factor TamB
VASIPREIEGEISGNIVLTGFPEAPTLQGRLIAEHGTIGQVSIDAGHIAILPVDNGYEIDSKITFGHVPKPTQKSRLSLERDEDVDSEPGWVSIGGFVPISWNGTALDLTQNGTTLRFDGPGIPIGVVSALLGEQSYATGLIEIDGMIRGSLERPRPKIVATVNGGAIDWARTGVRYEDIKLNLVFNKRRVTLRQLHAESSRLPRVFGDLNKVMNESGTADAEGSARLDGWTLKKVDMALNLDRFWLAGLPKTTLATSGIITATGTWPQLRVEGEIEVHDAYLEASEDLWLSHGSLQIDPIVTIERSRKKVKRVEVVDEVEIWESFDIAVTTDLNSSTGFLGRVPLDDRFGALYASLTTMALEVDLDGILETQIKQGEFSVVGEVETLSGKAQIFGAEFEIEEGTIAFTGGDPANPIMNLRAEHDAKEFGIVVARILGTPEAPELTLTSDDYPEDADVAAILIFGSPLSKMSDSQGQNNAFLLALAVNSLAGNLERSLGSKLWDIETNESGAIDAVRVGFSLGDDLFLMLGVNPDAEDDENIREATVEWNITPRLQAEVMTGDRQIGTADVFWTWRF